MDWTYILNNERTYIYFFDQLLVKKIVFLYPRYISKPYMT